MRHVKDALFFFMTTALIIMMPSLVFADSSNGSGTCYFNGNEIVSDFSSGSIADLVSDLQPGDDVTFVVDYTNKDSHDTDWYMENEILQTLEKTDAARKSVAGTGVAENGGYTYELIHTDKDGKDTVLFSNDEIGGEAKPGNLEGLEQATNALDSWFYLQTLGQGESGRITLKVSFEGETEVNDYMDTRGTLDLKFAVELTRKDSAGSKGRTGKGVDTGDSNYLGLWSAMFAAAAALLLKLTVISMRRDRKEAGPNE